MAEEFLRFLAGYIEAGKVKTDAIHGYFSQSGSIFYILEENGWEKMRKIRRNSMNYGTVP